MLLQNDLVHGWGLDFALRKCVDVCYSCSYHYEYIFIKFNQFLMLTGFAQPAHEKIGVVDSQWIVHQVVPSLGGQVRGELITPLRSYLHEIYTVIAR